MYHDVWNLNANNWVVIIKYCGIHFGKHTVWQDFPRSKWLVSLLFFRDLTSLSSSLCCPAMSPMDLFRPWISILRAFTSFTNSWLLIWSTWSDLSWELPRELLRVGVWTFNVFWLDRENPVALALFILVVCAASPVTSRADRLFALAVLDCATGKGKALDRWFGDWRGCRGWCCPSSTIGTDRCFCCCWLGNRDAFLVFRFDAWRRWVRAKTKNIKNMLNKTTKPSTRSKKIYFNI